MAKKKFWTRAKIVWSIIIFTLVAGLSTLSYLYFYTDVLLFHAATDPTPPIISVDKSEALPGQAIRITATFPADSKAVPDSLASITSISGTCTRTPLRIFGAEPGSGHITRTTVSSTKTASWIIVSSRECEITQIKFYILLPGFRITYQDTPYAGFQSNGIRLLRIAWKKTLSAPRGPDQLVNGIFNSPLTGWTVSPIPTPPGTGAISEGGRSVLALNKASASQTVRNLSQNSTYLLTGYCRTKSTAVLKARIELQTPDLGGSTLDTLKLLGPTGTSVSPFFNCFGYSTGDEFGRPFSIPFDTGTQTSVAIKIEVTEGGTITFDDLRLSLIGRR